MKYSMSSETFSCDGLMYFVKWENSPGVYSKYSSVIADIKLNTLTLRKNWLDLFMYFEMSCSTSVVGELI